jgi:hypothetical protein
MARHKTRALIRKPRDYAHNVPMRVTSEAHGLHGASVTLLQYNKGTCPHATVDNPHDKGTQADTCDHCFAIS